MKYKFPNEEEHLAVFIKWLFSEVISAGGDGDGLWFSKYHSVNTLLPLIENLKPDGWEVKINEDTINVWSHQEGLIITNNEDKYNSAPPWQQILIRY